MVSGIKINFFLCRLKSDECSKSLLKKLTHWYVNKFKRLSFKKKHKKMKNRKSSEKCGNKSNKTIIKIIKMMIIKKIIYIYMYD